MEGADSSLENLVIQNGSASGEYPDKIGGGMYNVNSSPTLTNCSFENNSAEGNGGGMYNENNSPTLTNCSFLENNSVGGGAEAWPTGNSLTLELLVREQLEQGAEGWPM